MTIKTDDMIGMTDAIALCCSISMISNNKMISVVENNYQVQGTLQGGTHAGAKTSRRLITASIPKSY